MAIEAGWMDETRTVIRYRCVSAWDWTDLHQAVKDSVALMDTVDHEVHQVIDLGTYTQLPKGNALGHFRLVMQVSMGHPHSGHVIMTNPNAFGRVLASTFMRIYSKDGIAARFHFVATLDEAQALLAELVAG